MLDHMIFNKSKWWEAQNQPLIGKQVKGVSVARYRLEGNSYNSLSFEVSTKAPVDVQGKVVAEAHNSAGTFVVTDDQSRLGFSGSNEWFKIDDLTIFGGVNNPLSHLYQVFKVLITRKAVSAC